MVSKLKRQLSEAFYVFVNPNTSQERTLIIRSWYLGDFIRELVFLVKRIIETSEHWKNDLLNPFNKHLGSVYKCLKKLTYYHKHFFSKFSVQNVSDANQRSPEKNTIKICRCFVTFRICRCYNCLTWHSLHLSNIFSALLWLFYEAWW